MDVVADFEGQLPLGDTILSVGGAILRSGSHILEIVGSSNDFSGTTGWVSCGTDLGGLASL